ncbi:hypothetical protein Q5530_16835 [Saccharothrix sp. BKS2]|uniref:hypothetical protein n=1 Tax=Saccharothrix sp. BKS2 TaxID=3064400 RepID=UPI0039E78A2E
MRLIALTALLAALGGSAATSSGATPAERAVAGPAVATPVARTTAVEPPTALDHAGLGPIRIGATFAEVQATGLISDRKDPGTGACAFHGLELPLRGSVVFDESRKAVSVIITRGPATTEGLGNGHEPSRVPELYPSAVPNAHGYKIALDTGNEYSAYSIDGTVITSLSLSRIGQTCHG